MKLKQIPINDISIAIAVFMLLMVTAAYYNWSTPSEENLKFGWEYGNIAEALVEGKGFASPFGEDSGPTAWMPPFYVFFLAAVFYLFGVKSIVSLWVVLIFKYAAISLCLLMLLHLTNNTDYHKYKYLFVPLFLGPLYLNRTTFFLTLHDVWLNLLLSCLMLFTFVTQIRDKSQQSDVYLFILAFVLPIANPPLALAFLIVESGYFLLTSYNLARSKSSLSSDTVVYDNSSILRKTRLFWLQKKMLKFILVLLFFGSSSILWTYRNYLIFSTFIPVKSNLWFDFYQANYLDDDGLVTNTTFLSYNPANKNVTQTEYFVKRETLFTQDYKSLSIRELQRDPYSLIDKILNRALSALIYTHHSDDIRIATKRIFTPEDLSKLHQAKLLLVEESQQMPLWISLTMSEEDFVTQIKPLRLTNEALIKQDWLARRQELMARNWGWKNILRTISISLIPFLCLLFILASKKLRKNVIFINAAVIYLVYLMPYILVSHYLRYQTPLIGLQSVFTFFFTCHILNHTSSLQNNHLIWGLRIGNWAMEIRHSDKLPAISGISGIPRQ